MKYRYDTETRVIVTDKGPWFDSEIGALEHEQVKIDEEIKPWIREANAALDLGEIYRGGGVLKLAELMRIKSAIQSALCIKKYQAQGV